MPDDENKKVVIKSIERNFSCPFRNSALFGVASRTV